MTTEIQTVETLRADVAPVVQQAGTLVVHTPEQYTGAAEFLKSLKAAQLRVTTWFAPMKKKAHDAHKEITSTEAATLKPLTDAEMTVKRKMLQFADEQERIRRQEQAKLQAAADEAARRERERLEREAEKLKTPELKAARLEQAAAVVAPVVTVASVKPEIKGQSVRITYKAKVVDVSKVPREYMLPNMDALNAIARSTKGAITIPGVEMYPETSLSSSAK